MLSDRWIDGWMIGHKDELINGGGLQHDQASGWIDFHITFALMSTRPGRIKAIQLGRPSA